MLELTADKALHCVVYLLATECYDMCLLMPSLEKVNCRSQLYMAVTGTNRSAFLSCVLKEMCVYCALWCEVVIHFNCAIFSCCTSVKPNTGVILHLKTTIRNPQTFTLLSVLLIQDQTYIEWR
jgi:hypothetical protein